MKIIAEPLTVQYEEVRKMTETICAPLHIEDYVVQPVIDVSPPKWHLAHTTWFFETFVLKPYSPNYQEYHPDFSFLFNSYYENVGRRVMRPNRGNMTRPSVSEVYGYRKYVDDSMRGFLENQCTQSWQSLLSLLRSDSVSCHSPTEMQSCHPICTMESPRMATSPRNHGLPEPSMIMPFAMMMSYGCKACRKKAIRSAWSMSHCTRAVFQPQGRQKLLRFSHAPDFATPFKS